MRRARGKAIILDQESNRVRGPQYKLEGKKGITTEGTRTNINHRERTEKPRSEVGCGNWCKSYIYSIECQLRTKITVNEKLR